MRRASTPSARVIRRFAIVSGLVAVGVPFADDAHGADPVITPVITPEPPIDEARRLFREGATLARDTQWGAALAAFERSRKLHPSAGTTYNVGVCTRALGRYVRARASFETALAEAGTNGDLSDATVDDIRRFIAEIDALVATIDVTISPPDATVTLDGEALVPVPSGPGLTRTAPDHFRVAVDPGAHVFVVARPEFGEAVKSVSVRPGERATLDLSMARLPATLTVNADRKGAVVIVDALDVGVAPVELSRPAGTVHVAVKRPGFLTYEVDAALRAGQKTDLNARLEPEKPSLFGRWWFWTAAGAVVAGAAITTYFLVRPEPERPATDGGGLGWTARVP